MAHRVLVSATFSKRFRKLDKDEQRRIRKALEVLEEDPLTPRSGADIKPLKNTDPPKHRLRVGDWRVVYRVEKRTVKIIDLFRRGRGYRE